MGRKKWRYIFNEQKTIKTEKMKYNFKAFSKLTISNAQTKLIEHYNKVGIYENFGQEVIRHLKDKYNYSPYSYNPKDKAICGKIERLDEWAMNFCG